MNAMRIILPYLIRDTDLRGNDRYYVRRHGRKIRIGETPGTEAFAKAYSEALDALTASALSDHRRDKNFAPKGSLGWLAALYFTSAEFRRLAAQSQVNRRSIIEECLREPLKPGSPDIMSGVPLGVLSAKHIMVLRDRRAGAPGAANNRRKYLSSMFGWAVENGLLKANPARDVRSIRYASAGFHTWTVEEVRQFEAFYPVGSKARLALALMLYLGVRRGDVVTLGKQHVKDGWIRFVPKKTRYRREMISEKPVLPELGRIIAASPCGDMTFLVTQAGAPFTAKGFGGRMRDWCDKASLPHCSAHGLRKAGATLAAQGGATDRQLMALFDWSSASQATTYTRAADRRHLAGEAGQILSDQMENKSVPLSVPLTVPLRKRHDKS